MLGFSFDESLSFGAFGVLKQNQLRRGVFTSVQELEEAITRFIDTHNNNKKPFVWTKSAEEILVKVGRARQALSYHQTV